MLLVLFKLDLFGKIVGNSVNPHPDKAAFTHAVKLLDILAFSAADNG